MVTTTVLTAFIYTFVLHEPVLGITRLADEHKRIAEITQKIDKFVLPYRFGRVVNSSLVSSDRLVIYIQDLHCHPEVQKNIYEIIKLLDSKSNVTKIFAEGAPKGKVDTKVLSALPDEIRNKMLEGMLKKGLIGGAEYYSIVEGKDKLYGLEDWNTYLANYERIKDLLANKEKHTKIADTLNDKLDNLKTKYISKEVKKLEKTLNPNLQIS
ncbi:MAG: hypothetical protein AABX51_08915, partial [Nanoarchaeota archaeon]